MRQQQLVLFVLDEHHADELKDADEHDDDQEAQVETGLLSIRAAGLAKVPLDPRATGLAKVALAPRAAGLA